MVGGTEVAVPGSLEVAVVTDLGTAVVVVVLDSPVDVVGRLLVVLVPTARVVEVDAGARFVGSVVVVGEFEMTMLSLGGRLFWIWVSALATFVGLVLVDADGALNRNHRRPTPTRSTTRRRVDLRMRMRCEIGPRRTFMGEVVLVMGCSV